MVKKISKVIVYLFIVMVLLVIVGGIVYLTRGGKSDIKTFYIKVNDRIIARDESHVDISSGNKIQVKSSADYNVALYAYTEYHDFKFTVGGEEKNWSDYDETDFLSDETCGIELLKETDGFTLTYSGFESIVSKTDEVRVDNLTSDFDMFRLVITSNGCDINIYAKLFVMPNGIKLDKTQLIFGR